MKLLPNIFIILKIFMAGCRKHFKIWSHFYYRRVLVWYAREQHVRRGHTLQCLHSRCIVSQQCTINPEEPMAVTVKQFLPQTSKDRLKNKIFLRRSFPPAHPSEFYSRRAIQPLIIVGLLKWQSGSHTENHSNTRIYKDHRGHAVHTAC